MEATLFGLPAHPLLVHGVVVLIPLAAVAMTVMALVPRTRRHLVWATLVVAVVGAVLTPLAAESGEELAHTVRETQALEAHEGLGENLTPFAVALAIGAAALAADHVRAQRAATSPAATRQRTWIRLAVSGLALATAVAATAQTVWVGHSGASATWARTASADSG